MARLVPRRPGESCTHMLDPKVSRERGLHRGRVVGGVFLGADNFKRAWDGTGETAVLSGADQLVA